MQLAGKPSLIDPTRAMAGKDQPKGPLQVEKVEITQLEGEVGAKLEQFYAAYFEVQEALAADQTPPADAAQRVAAQARDLAETLPEPSRERARKVAAQAEHLHHMNLVAARKAFKPISHAVIALATQVRGTGAEQSFTHFHCPMVADGGADWLQPGGELQNPYFGSEMLRCGEKVAEYGPDGRQPAERPDQRGANHAPNVEG
jgi:Cu(I)/Ag(I) efflux system membrane fusion protein